MFLLTVGKVRDSHHALAAGDVQAGRLLDIDVLPVFSRPLEMFRVKEHRRRNHDGVHVAARRSL